MNPKKMEKILEQEKRFVCSIKTEFENRNNSFQKKLKRCKSLPEIEFIILENIRFIVNILEIFRKRNKHLAGDLGMDYTKIVGLTTPYEEAIRKIRDVKIELDSALKVVREVMLDKMKHPNKYISIHTK